MKKNGKIPAILCAAILICTPVSATQPLPSETVEGITNTQDVQISPEIPAVVAEDIGRREPNVKHFVMSDGSYVAVTYSEPVHYRQGDEWMAIDNSLIPATLLGDPATGEIRRNDELTAEELSAVQQQGALSARTAVPTHTGYMENRANPFTVQLPQQLNSRTPVAVRYGGHELRFVCEQTNEAAAVPETPAIGETAAETAAVDADAAATDAAAVQTANERAMAAENLRSAIAFPSAWEGADLHYAIAGQTLKETIVLQAVPTNTSFSFCFTYTGLQAVAETDGSVLFSDEAGEPVFRIAAPFMTDAEDGYSTAVSVTLEPTASGCRYTLTPDREWLEDAARVYPVTIDQTVPTTQNASYIHDNGVQQSNPDTNYISADRIYIGSSSSGQEGRMYFKLTQWPSAEGLNPSSITKAYMLLSYYPTASYQTGKAMDIDAYHVASVWDTSSITWNNQPGVTGRSFGGAYIVDSIGQISGYDAVDVTEWVQTHYLAPNSDTGLCLKPRVLSSSSNRVCYISSDYYAKTSLRPVINIYYTGTSGESAGIITNDYYYIKSAYSGKYLDVANNGGSETGIVQYTFNGGLNQIFRIDHESNGLYTFTPMHNTDLQMDVPGYRDENGLNWQVYTRNSSSGQRFRILSNGQGTYRIMPACSSSRVMDIEGPSTSDGAPIQMWTWDNNAAQMKWIFEKVEYGCGGEYRPIATTQSINCFGYAMLVDDVINFGISGNSHISENNKESFEQKLRQYVSSYRQIENFLTIIGNDEYRIAVRIPNGYFYNGCLYNFHVIYQLSDGTWAGKNAEAASKHFGKDNPSVTPEMWDGNNYYPQSCGTLYYAVKK